VLPAVKQALREQFSFARRRFAQSVALSEVTAVMQDVPGVEAVNVIKLEKRVLDDAGNLQVVPTLEQPPQRLPSEGPRANDQGEVLAAELLTLDPGLINVGEMK
jgi:hypothetical protein